MKTLLFLILFPFLLASCSDGKKKSVDWNNHQDAGLDAEPDAVEDVTDVMEPDADAGPVDPDPPPVMAGTWAHVQVNGSLINMPMVGLQSNKLVSLVLVDIAQQDNELVISEHVCDIKIESSTTMVTTIIPQAFINSMPVEVKQTQLEWTGQAYRYAQPQHWALQGVNLENIETDPLPTDPADERVFDQDNDGHPGLTVSVTGLLSGDIYVIQRGWNAMVSQTLTEDAIFGLMTWDNEQVVLGATNSILLNPIDSTVDTDPAKSWFEFVRIDSSWTCTEIINQKTVLFPRLAQ